jgi:hypothetical protein
MTIEELDAKAFDVATDIKYDNACWEDITKLSIEFAISVLNDVLGNVQGPLINCKYGLDKIQELKKELENEC